MAIREHLTSLAKQLDRLLGECRTALTELHVAPTDLTPLGSRPRDRTLRKRLTHHKTMGWSFWIRLNGVADDTDNQHIAYLYPQPRAREGGPAIGESDDGSWAWAKPDDVRRGISTRVAESLYPLAPEEKNRSYLTEQVTTYARNATSS